MIEQETWGANDNEPEIRTEAQLAETLKFGQAFIDGVNTRKEKAKND